MIPATLLPLLLASLAYAGPITARDEQEDGQVEDKWASLPVTRLHWQGDYEKCLGIESAEQATKLVIRDCGGFETESGTETGWKYNPDTATEVINAHSQLCLTGGVNDGDEVDLQPCNPEDQGIHERQLWWYMGGDDLHLAQFEMSTCLDYKDGGYSEDARLQSYTCLGDNSNQQWIAQVVSEPEEVAE